MDTIIYYLIQILKFIVLPFRQKSFKTNEEAVKRTEQLYPKKSYRVQEAVRIAQENSEKLISPLGEFHWRGLFHPDKLHIGSGGEFHSNEQGDATLHTGSYLASQVFRYKATNDDKIIPIISLLLNYFELHQRYNNGGLGRMFVKDKFYQQFPKEEQNGISKDYNVFNEGEASKFSQRYRPFVYNGEKYWQRYDISVDAISHALFGLFMTYLFVPSQKERAKDIILLQYEYYRRSDWKIIDEEGRVVRYGNHSTKINFFSRINELIFQYVEKGTVTPTWKDMMVINGIPSYLKGLRINYFNSFINICQLLSLHEMGIDVRKGVSRLRKEMSEGDNWLLNSVYHYITKDKIKCCWDLEEWCLNYGHPAGTLYSERIVSQHVRNGYNKWEFSPNRCLFYTNGTELTGNHDLLLAYWII